MSCADCQAPSVGFTGPIPGINKKGSVYRGAIPQRFGNRKPPSSAYATFSPIFHYDPVEELFIGGNFWDGRATGEVLGNPAADQALGPFLNPVEQNNPSKEAVLMQIANGSYAYLWEEVWGEPIDCSTDAKIAMNYDRVGLVIAAYEASAEVNSFTSKFDYYLAGLVELTEQEMWGMELFNNEEEGGGKCSLCHPSTADPISGLILFTDFTFDNLGVPKNPDNPFYEMDEVYLDDGSPINPEGADWIDPGLGGFLQTAGYEDEVVAENWGKHKVPTLRNVGKRPGDGFTKAYMHNGVFKSLKEVVHFYNTRDVEEWPAPELAENVNTDELGDLGLTDAEEDAIVAFMETLSDGYKLPKSSDPVKDHVVTTMAISPNPAYGQARLNYSLKGACKVEVSIYSLSGERIETVDQGWQAMGTRYLTLDVSGYPAGVYLVGLKAGGRVLTDKLTVLH